MENQNKGKAIASMVLGIVSNSMILLAIIVAFFWQMIGITIATGALICAIIAIVLSRHAVFENTNGQGVAGFVLGITGASLSAVVIFISFIFITFFS